MTRFTAILLLLALFSVAYLSNARKEPAGEYWNRVMEKQAMPKALRDLLPSGAGGGSDPAGVRFATNFQTMKTNPAIIYHSPVDKASP
nr:organ-specific protein P4-like [Ipomoea batatas]GMD53874.1 organ-specific protein P4-like [Ipomoea batatas]